jgi:hypothetical protein
MTRGSGTRRCGMGGAAEKSAFTANITPPITPAIPCLEQDIQYLSVEKSIQGYPRLENAMLASPK